MSPGMRAKLQEHHQAGFGWAMTCCRLDREEAMEVLQASYVKILDGKAQFDGRSEFRTWMFGVIRRTAAEMRRRRIVREMALTKWLQRTPAPPPASSPDSVHETTQVHRRLRQLLQKLSQRQQDLMHLVFYQEMTIEQAAGVLDITLGTARTHYKRGKAQLKKLLEESGEKSWNRMTMTTTR